MLGPLMPNYRLQAAALKYDTIDVGRPRVPELKGLFLRVKKKQEEKQRLHRVNVRRIINRVQN